MTMSKQTDQQQNEKPLSDEEQRLIGEVAGHLFDRCDEVRHTEKFQALAAEHDAVMRLRRLYDQQQKEIATYAALCAQMAVALEAIKLASETGATADTPAMRTFDGVCRAVKELPGASMARDIYESHIDSIWEEADRALTAYRTLSPDPQWQRVPEECVVVPVDAPSVEALAIALWQKFKPADSTHEKAVAWEYVSPIGKAHFRLEAANLLSRARGEG